jgi:succinyl-CoA synthetase beta subunit
MIASTAKSLSRAVLRRTATPAVGAVRNINIHEYMSMDLMKQHQIGTPAGYVASSPEEAENIYLNKLNKRKSQKGLCCLP